MKRINIFSDDTMEEKKNFIISTFIWADPSACRDYENEIGKIVEDNKKRKILDPNFKGFHASKLNHSNWNRLSGPYKEVLNKWRRWLFLEHLFSFIYLESRKKYEENSRALEEDLIELLNDRNSHLGKPFQHINNKDLKSIYKRAHKIYFYLVHRGKFGGPNVIFEYYPDASGSVLHYKNRKFCLKVPGKDPFLVDYFTMISRFVNALAVTLNRPESLNILGWDPRPNNQKLKRFEPKRDEESFLIQTCDIISNFFLNLIKYQVGDRSKTAKLKANVLLKLEIFDNILDDIKENFKLQNDRCVCSNEEFKACLPLKSKYGKTEHIIFR